MKKFYLTGVLLTLSVAACQQAPTTTVTTNTTGTNMNSVNTSSSNTGVNMSNANFSNSATSTMIEAREPDQYQATMTLRLETMGAQQSNLPPLVAQIARSGENKRMEFSLPGGEKVVYLDRADKRLLVLPNRKQYAELDPESTGFNIRQMMTPGQMIQQAKTYKGVERVGEEQFNGRTAVRYRYGAVTDTKSQAGQVETQSYFLVDKDTGLPLRSETVSESTSGGNVQGVQGLRIITETSNIQTNVPADLFAEPTEYRKVAPEEVRAQVNGIFQVATMALGQLMKANTQQAPQTANTPAQNTPRP